MGPKNQSVETKPIKASNVQQPAAQVSGLPAGYPEFLADLKTRIRFAQVKAALSANRELILLYWDIGRRILERQQDEGCGTKVIDRLSADLRKAFPDIKGFSPRNIKYIWGDPELTQKYLRLKSKWGQSRSQLDSSVIQDSFFAQKTKRD